MVLKYLTCCQFQGSYIEPKGRFYIIIFIGVCYMYISMFVKYSQMVLSELKKKLKKSILEIKQAGGYT